MRIYRCQDSIESIFTAIYNAYEDRANPDDTELDLKGDMKLFAEDVEVVPDIEKTKKVMRTLERQFGDADYYDICSALASTEPDKANDVYHTVVWGLKTKPARGHLLDHMTDPHIASVFRMAKNVWRETHHLYGFVRFEEGANKLLFSKIGPKNNILSFLMPHFSDRLPMENFIIYDEIRGFFGIHPAGKQWFFLREEDSDEVWDRISKSGENDYFAELFCGFVKSITIESRRNEKLQRNLLPLRFREYMVEFQ